MTTGRRLPPVDPATGRFEISPDLTWRPCPVCGHLAWRNAGEAPPTWTCDCWPEACTHRPVQEVHGDEITMVRRPYTFRDRLASDPP